MNLRSTFFCFTALVVGLSCLGCTVEDSHGPSGNGSSGSTTGASAASAELEGTIQIDGSSTVFPISQAVAEEFGAIQPKVRVVVGTSGTGGGFKKFVVGESDINDASRPIKDSERELCKENGIEFIELKVAIDGLSVIVNPENDWSDCLSVSQLKAIWEPGSKITKWSEVDKNWPDEPIKLYGPDTDSGTFDYFTEAICGEGGASRDDYTPSTDDNVLVRGVAGDKYSLGYFGYAYYIENKDQLNIVGVAQKDDKSDCVAPTDESIEAGDYAPLSRPLFIYVNVASLKRPEVVEFLTYYLNEGQELVGQVGYVKLSEEAVEEAKKTLEDSIAAAADGGSEEEGDTEEKEE